MSPPIFNPDGSEVSEIVLPDGSTASEVIDPDGNVVFEAGPDIPDNVVDNFEESLYENQNNTLSDYYRGVQGGGLSRFSRITSNTIEGSQSLKGVGSAPQNEAIQSDPRDGLPNYPERGDSFEFQLNVSSYWAEVGFAGSGDVPPSGDRYSAFFDDSEFSLLKTVSGSSTPLDTSSPSISTGETYRVEVTFGDPTITLELYDGQTSLSSLSADDTSFDSGGIFWRVNGNGGEAIFDGMRII